MKEARLACAIALALCGLLLPAAAARGAYPERPVRYVVGSAAGGLLACTVARPVQSVKDLISYAKNTSEKLLYASSGNASSVHVGMELFKLLTGTPQQFAELIKREAVRWADVVKRSGAKMD